MNRQNYRGSRPAPPPGHPSGTGQRETYRVKQNRRPTFQIFLIRFLLMLMIYALLMVSTALAFAASLREHTDPELHTYRYQVGIDDDPSVHARTVSWDTVFRNDTFYINFSELAKLCSFAELGDHANRRFVAENGETVDFILNSSLCFVNGVITRLSEIAIYENDTLYVPMSFAEHYMNGVTVTYNAESADHRLTVGRNGTLNNSRAIVYEEVSFVQKPVAPEAAIDLTTLPYEILRLTVLPTAG